jgi:hypothetical protein
VKPLGRYAYTLTAVVQAGVPPSIAKKLLADGPRCTPERPRISATGRARGLETTFYVWGPDANTLLAEPAQKVSG